MEPESQEHMPQAMSGPAPFTLIMHTHLQHSVRGTAAKGCGANQTLRTERTAHFQMQLIRV